MFNLPKAKQFALEHFEFCNNEATFHYSLDKYDFTEKIKINFPEDIQINSSKKILEKALRFAHFALAPSYWKTFIPPKILAPKNDFSFWKKAYTKGLGEFFYVNNIDFRNLINFEEIKNENKVINPQEKKGKIVKNLLCLGGGKDSLLSAKKMVKNGISFTPLILGNNQIAIHQAKIMGKKPIIIERKLDSQLFDLNKQGAYNGHVPFSLILSSLATLVAVLINAENIIVSNEYSANYGNIKFLDKKINHQWSKSWEAEKMIHNHIHKNISKNINYFSYLRSFWEIKIVQMFLENDDFLHDFSSCNRNFTQKTNNPPNTKKQFWCGKCPKCAFVFSLFSAFLDRKKLIEIFGKNLFEDEKMSSIFYDLYAGQKPFECVGQKEEVISALQSAIKIQKPSSNEVILNEFIEAKITTISLEKLLNFYGENNIPKNL